MKRIEDNEFLNGIIREFQIKIPTKLSDLSIYKEIQNFNDAEYIYCIGYEMLIRTDEYNKLLQNYKPLRNKSKFDMTNDEFSKLNSLIKQMNELGLKKTSFLGFDYENDNDHVFKRIEYYNEIINSPWSVRMLHKFNFDSNESIFYLLAKFYFEKGELYTLIEDYYYRLPIETRELVIGTIKNKSQWKNQKECNDFYDFLDSYYIPCLNLETDKVEYKSLSSNTIYLSELDKDFLSLLKEKKSDELLIQTKSEFSYNNIEFWNKYSINDIKDGLSKLVDFHIQYNLIYDKSGMRITSTSKTCILENPTEFYIPCVNRMEKPELFQWSKMNDEIPINDFQQQLRYNGHNSIIAYEGFLKLKSEYVICLVSIDEHISLSYLHDLFLETLVYEDLKNIYIDTEPIFSRPRLMFDEGRLTNIPVNLNLSKEDLLLYISQIKDNYDRDKNIVKSDEEYFFDLTLESDLIQIPKHFKSANEKRTTNDKDYFKIKRHEFTKEFASAFYIYDLFKFFVRLFKIKRKCVRRMRGLEIKKIKETAKREGTIINQIEIAEAKDRAKKELANYQNNNLITQISYLFNDLSEDMVKYYLATMKDFIHGVNKKGENYILKKKYSPGKKENTEPKYKNLIIGDSYFIKSNDEDLLKKLGITSSYKK